MGTIYLIHFDRPYKHARHYIGFTDDLRRRIEAHRDGGGSRLMQVVKEAGIGWHVARLFSGDRNFERRLKNRKNAANLCATCREERGIGMGEKTYGTIEDLLRLHPIGDKTRVYEVNNGDDSCFVVARSKGEAALACSDVELVSRAALLKAFRDVFGAKAEAKAS
jgi:predicted GIY-YIG superfamily endonuclease